jgi:outer membrane protein assembly factor BamB
LDNLVITHVGGHDDGALTAFDAATGTVHWAWDGDGPGYASPVAADIDGTRQVITLSQNHVVGVSAATGELLWQRPFTTPHQQNSIDPIVIDDVVIVAGVQTPTAAFRVSRGANSWTTEDVWNNQASFYMANGVLVDNRLFGLSDRSRGQYVLLDMTSGETAWSSEGRRAENAAILKTDDLVFVLEEDAELIVGRVVPAGFEEIRRYDVADSATWAQPAISGSRVWVKDVTTLALWTFN